MENSKVSLYLGVPIAIGLVLAGWVLGAQIKAVRLSDRYVTVRGLVERTVKSDLAVWTIGYKEAGNDLTAVYAKTEADKSSVMEFLQQQGIQASEIEVGVVGVTDTQANEYGGSNRAPQRYIVAQRITVRTARVDQVAAAAQKSMQLLQKGVVLTNSNGNGGVSYKFTGLNSIKPDMITEATRNARAAADRFAKDSGSSVGSIRQANQGVFSILAAEQGSDAGEENPYGGSSDSSIQKVVRVVTTVQYYLDR